MNKFKLIFFIFILLAFNYTFSQKFYPVPSTIIDISNFSPNTTQLNVNRFSISEFITVSDYKDYLNSIRKDSSLKFYHSQLPKSNIISKKMMREILKSENLQDEPMPCVTWISAKNYCKWLTSKAVENNLNYSYDIPFLSQVIAFNNLYELSDTKKLLTWTNNNYDESIMASSKYFEYSYDALNSDSPALKRKIIYGTSYHMTASQIQLSKLLNMNTKIVLLGILDLE